MLPIDRRQIFHWKVNRRGEGRTFAAFWVDFNLITKLELEKNFLEGNWISRGLLPQISLIYKALISVILRSQKTKIVENPSLESTQKKYKVRLEKGPIKWIK